MRLTGGVADSIARTLLHHPLHTQIVTERVQCAECERIYDSDDHPFCPRCGATAKADPTTAAKTIASRNDPRRRRVQVAGVIMASTGALVLLAGIAMLASAGSVWGFASEYGTSDDTLAGNGTSSELAQTAGSLNVTMLQGGEPLQGVMLELHDARGTLLGTASTDADGTAQFDGITQLVIQLHVAPEDTDWVLEFIPLGTTQGSDSMELILELEDQSVVSGPLMDRSMVETTTRIMGGGAILLGITPIIGGIAALRLKNQQMALFGAVIGGIPWLFLFVASMSLPLLVITAMFVMAVVFVRQGRDLFA